MTADTLDGTGFSAVGGALVVVEVVELWPTGSRLSLGGELVIASGGALVWVGGARRGADAGKNRENNDLRSAITVRKQEKRALLRALRYHRENIQMKKWGYIARGNNNDAIAEKGLQNTTVAQVLMTKGEDKFGSWLWCRTDDTVYDAVKQMAQNNIGSLVVLKPGEQQLIAGIFTERDYLRKVIVQDKQSKHTKVGEIMTEQDKLITVKSDTNILQAMQLMTENNIRHAPVIDGKIVGMISMVDVVRAVLEQQHREVKRLNEFIRGDYY